MRVRLYIYLQYDLNRAQIIYSLVTYWICDKRQDRDRNLLWQKVYT